LSRFVKWGASSARSSSVNVSTGYRIGTPDPMNRSGG
jgi:hypothetical protein